MIVASTSASGATVRESPARLLRFLEGLADPAVGAELSGAGLTDAHVDQAWALFDELRRASRLARPQRNETLEAMTACERWQATHLVRVRALWSLERPEEARALFGDLEPGPGMLAVMNARTFLARWADRDDDAVPRAALQQLRASVVSATRVAAARDDGEEEERSRTRDAIKRRMHAWVTAWSAIARTAVVRRDHLIRLGIAARREISRKSR